jgi:hypothetical protein
VKKINETLERKIKIMADRKCITCKWCYPEIEDDEAKERYIYDYTKSVCASHDGIYVYGTELGLEQLNSYPDCWEIGFDEWVRVGTKIVNEDPESYMEWIEFEYYGD